jgi:hypothetical protein
MTDDRQFVAVRQIMAVSFFQLYSPDEDIELAYFQRGKQGIFFKIITSVLFCLPGKINTGTPKLTTIVPLVRKYRTFFTG